jgi:para-nitrobenzyl esterase
MQEITDAQNAVNKKVTSLNPLFFFEPWLPVVDNVIVRGQLLNMVQNTSFPLKPFIIGTVTEECLDFVYSNRPQPITPSEYIGVVLALFGEKGFKILKQYPPDGEGDQRPLVARACTQWVFSCSTRVFARKAASYFYAFGYSSDTENSIQCRGAHACHGDDLPFTFESFWPKFSDAGRRVSQSIATYWTNFAKSQDPNEPLRVPLAWPRVTTGNETYMYIQDPLQIGENYLKNDCDFWDEIGYK